MNVLTTPTKWWIRLTTGGHMAVWADGYSQVGDQHIFTILVELAQSEPGLLFAEIADHTPSDPSRVSIVTARVPVASVESMKSEWSDDDTVATEATTTVTEEGGSTLEDLAASCGGESFSAGSQVVLASGASVAISQLWPGAQVLATDPQTGRTQAETVNKLWVNHDTDLMDVVVQTAGGTGTIDSTAHHLFWDLTTKTWTEADQLRAGDRLWTPDGQLATVVRAVTIPGVENMWDLTVANDHDFYVITLGTAVLVHNCPMGPPDQVTGYTDHGLDQAISRDAHGVSPRAILNAVGIQLALSSRRMVDGCLREVTQLSSWNQTERS
jgi:hypothetical protein